MNGLFDDGVQRAFPDDQIGGRAVRPQVLKHHFHILFDLKKLIGQLAVVRFSARVCLKNQVHGRDGGLYLVNPHGIIVLHLRPLLLFLPKQPVPLLIGRGEKPPVQKLQLIGGLLKGFRIPRLLGRHSL